MAEKLTSMTASTEWASRPDDQRFWDLAEMNAVMGQHRRSTDIVNLDLKELRLETATVSGKETVVARVPGERHLVHLNYWPMDQLCKTVKAPASFLRTLPAERAADTLNFRIKQFADNAAELNLTEEDDEFRPSQVMIRKESDGLHAIGLTSQRYGRIWNHKITENLMSIGGGWKVPPARPPLGDGVDKSKLLDGNNLMWDPKVANSWSAEQLLSRPRLRTASAHDVEGINPGGLGIPVKVGDVIAPAGLYGTHSEMFVLMVDPSRRIEEGGLARGFILKNSEVGNGSFVLWAFYLEGVCGNHCLWGLKEMLEIRVVHLGDKAEVRAFDRMGQRLKLYADSDTSREETVFANAAKMILGKDRDEVVDTVFSKKILTRSFAEVAYDTAVESREIGMMNFEPNSVRGMVFGATRASQTHTKWVDSRVTLDRAAGKLLQLADV